MFCHKCGIETPDDSQFCRKCGNALTDTGKTSTTLAAAPAKAQGVRTPLVLGLIFALVVFGWLIINSLQQQRDAAVRRAAAATQVNVPAQPVLPVLHTMDIGKGALAVAAMHYAYYSLAVPPGARNVKVQGRFTAAGGAGNDIFVFLLNEDGFTNWKNRHQVPAYYSSGKVTVGDVNAALPNDAGNYYLVFDNRFSMLTAKAVEFTGTMTYYQ
jgi:hypothetical protein